MEIARIRPVDLAQDASAIEAIDTGFTTSESYHVTSDGSSFSLELMTLDRPISKRFPLDDLRGEARPWSDAWVAEDGGRIVGFVAVGFEPWNRRLVIWHLYVDTGRRGQGTGRTLLAAAKAHGRAKGARSLWLETSSLNAPGVAAYRSMGFALTGVDLTLYDGTPAAGETALFFSRAL